jgi:hypothetical protein
MDRQRYSVRNQSAPRQNGKAGSSQCLRRNAPRSGISALGSAGLQQEFVSVQSTKIAPLIVVRHSLAMGGYERQNRASSTVPKPSSRAASASSTDAQSPARVTLPNDLSGSLKYLDDAQLQTLLQAVIVEINRRKQAPKNKTATTKSSRGPPATFRDNKIGEIDEIPEGRANLIRASFRAGIKPATIARTFRISQSLVNHVLSSIEEPKR